MVKNHRNNLLKREKAPAKVQRRKVHIRMEQQKNLHPQRVITEKISPKMPLNNYLE